jgi:hypothetical protein
MVHSVKFWTRGELLRRILDAADRFSKWLQAATRSALFTNEQQVHFG